MVGCARTGNAVTIFNVTFGVSTSFRIFRRVRPNDVFVMFTNNRWTSVGVIVINENATDVRIIVYKAPPVSSISRARLFKRFDLFDFSKKIKIFTHTNPSSKYPLNFVYYYTSHTHTHCLIKYRESRFIPKI